VNDGGYAVSSYREVNLTWGQWKKAALAERAGRDC
jgi:hypothetical protein